MTTYEQDCRKEADANLAKIKEMGISEEVQKMVTKFIKSKYKNDRLYGRGKEYGDLVISSAIIHHAETGFSCIGVHESADGKFKLLGVLR